jgi:hypothetical protein
MASGVSDASPGANAPPSPKRTTKESTLRCNTNNPRAISGALEYRDAVGTRAHDIGIERRHIAARCSLRERKQSFGCTDDVNGHFERGLQLRYFAQHCSGALCRKHARGERRALVDIEPHADPSARQQHRHAAGLQFGRERRAQASELAARDIVGIRGRQTPEKLRSSSARLDSFGSGVPAPKASFMRPENSSNFGALMSANVNMNTNRHNNKVIMSARLVIQSGEPAEDLARRLGKRLPLRTTLTRSRPRTRRFW